MKKALAIALVLGGLNVVPAAAMLIPAIDTPGLIAGADLIVVGRAVSADSPANVNAGLQRFVVSVDRVLKGGDAPSQLILQLDVSELGYEPVAPQQYGIFLLRH